MHQVKKTNFLQITIIIIVIIANNPAGNPPEMCCMARLHPVPTKNALYNTKNAMDIAAGLLIKQKGKYKPGRNRTTPCAHLELHNTHEGYPNYVERVLCWVVNTTWEQ